MSGSRETLGLTLLAESSFLDGSVGDKVRCGDGKPHDGFEADAVGDLQFLVGALGKYRFGAVDKAAEYHC